MRTATLILGRDGMGDASEDDFDAWVSYVQAHLDERAGSDVTVEVRGKRDVQSDAYRGDDDGVVREAVNDLWVDFCEDAAAWPPNGGAS